MSAEEPVSSGSAPLPLAPEPQGALLANVVRFGRLLRRLGFAASPERAALLAEGLQAIPLDRRGDVKAAARAVYTDRHEQQELFDRAFDLFFDPRRRAGTGFDLAALLSRTPGATPRKLALLDSPAAGQADMESGDTVAEPHLAASDREQLRHKDFARLTPGEAEQLRAWIRELPFALDRRATRRQVRARAGARLDLRQTLRRSLRYGGEPIELAWRRRKEKPRPLVALCDVSGSMEPYARVLLQFLYALCRSPVLQGAHRYHAFAFGTRLTSLTRLLSDRDADRALARATAAVADWGGGTRIGESLHRFNYDWGRRVLGQGSVVLLISDGWDRGDPHQLEREVARLHRSCERLIWLNPLLGRQGYQPLTRGMAAALPHVDEFLPVHNLASLEQLAAVLGGVGGRRRAPLPAPSL
jgi:hypothetical protein